MPFFSYIYSFYKKNRLIITTSIVLSIIQAILLIPIAYFLKQTFDLAIPRNDTKQMIIYGVSIITCFIISSTIGLYVRWKILEFVKIHIKNLQLSLVKKFLSLPRAFYSHLSPEKLQLIMTAETARQDGMINALFGTFLPSAIICIILIVFLFWINPFLFIVTLMGLSSVLIFHRLLINKSKISSNQFHNAYNNFCQGIMFISHKTDLIHTQATETYETLIQEKKIDAVRSTSIKMIKTNTLFKYIQENIMIILSILLLFAGAILVTSKTMSIGELLSFYLVIGLLKSHLRTFSVSLPDIIEGKESYKTLNEFLSFPDPIYNGSKKLNVINNISLNNIHFSYKKKEILKGIDLYFTKGKCIVLSGNNGSGKSTIIAIIEGLYKPSKGNISINNIDFNHIDISHFRKQIGIVQQQPILFSGNIYDNITYGNSNVDEIKVKKAAAYIGIDAFIESLPEKYNTKIGDNGILLSGGQQQRIALARAILNEPSLLILDEPTNHLDTTGVTHLLNQLKTLPFNPTILVVSHHKLMFEIADQVYHLENGKTTKIK
ncbi:ABC transporter ATP-binding protein [Tenacibaculum sp.]|nr:ABC transporter ATP-binding protein [Tenacibaculum sp.]